MLFSAVKDRSLTVLKFVMALFIVVAPTLFGFLNIELSACILFILTGVLYVSRIRKTGQCHISICQFVMMTLLFYSVVSTLWADNKNGHFTYILIISGLIMFFELVSDYFSENNDVKLQRRMMYMLSLSGTLCALWNIIYWVVFLIPYGKKDGFSAGLGNSDFLAVFMLFCIILTYKLMCKNKPLRKALFFVSLLIMVFTFVMTGSFVWFLLLVFAVMFFVTRKTKKLFVPMTLLFAGLFLAFIIVSANMNGQGTVFSDVFKYGIKNLFGHGGGFWTAREMFFSGEYTNVSIPGLFAYLCAATGLTGIIVCVALTGRVVFHFLKLKTWASAANIFITLMIMLLPMAQSPVPVFLWAGLIAYNENDAKLSPVKTIRKDTVKYTTYVIAVSGVLTAVMLCRCLIIMNASHKYENRRYIDAYELYNIAATISPVDAESCRMAAKALYMSDDIKNRHTEAIELVNKAQKRDKYNLENMHIKAQIYYKCEMYELSAQEYMDIASRVAVDSVYNLETVKSLYNIIRTKEKGSVEAKTLYEKMAEIASNTADLDYREKINNIVDKALVYTKGELTVER